MKWLYFALLSLVFWAVSAQPATPARLRFVGAPGSVSVAAPTFIQEAETVWSNTSNPKTTASFDVLLGDVLVAFSVIENSGSAVGISGGSLTWTLQQSVTASFYCQLFLWTAVVDADKSMSVTFTRSGNTYYFGGNVLTFRGSDGIGNSSVTNVASGAPTLNITTTQANSAIVLTNGDWNASDGASRVWRTNAGALSETSYFRNTTNYAIYGGYHADAGAINTYAVGLSAPSGQGYSIAAVEVLGSAAAAVSDPPFLFVRNPMGRYRRM